MNERKPTPTLGAIPVGGRFFVFRLAAFTQKKGGCNESK